MSHFFQNVGREALIHLTNLCRVNTWLYSVGHTETQQPYQAGIVISIL